MKKKATPKLRFTGVITVDLPPQLHEKISRIAKQANAPIETVISVLLALQFPANPSGKQE